MSKRSDDVYIQDIIESIELIQYYIGDSNQFDFSQNMMMQDAINRRFEIIGEAASSISSGFKSIHTEIPWKLMKDMRNKLAHEYFGVSDSTIYRTIKIDLPHLKYLLSELKEQN